MADSAARKGRRETPGNPFRAGTCRRAYARTQASASFVPPGRGEERARCTTRVLRVDGSVGRERRDTASMFMRRAAQPARSASAGNRLEGSGSSRLHCRATERKGATYEGISADRSGISGNNTRYSAADAFAHALKRYRVSLWEVSEPPTKSLIYSRHPSLNLSVSFSNIENATVSSCGRY